jgi:D-glycero-D-manno-heptose 1,7-bisphosphate phosphatase
VQESFVHEAHRHIAERLSAGGARVDAFYYCPHHRDGVIEALRIECGCRKPGADLLKRAAADLGLDLARSFAVGDRWHDVQAGQAVGATGVLVRTGYGRSQERAPREGVRAAAVADNLMEAVSWMLRQP